MKVLAARLHTHHMLLLAVSAAAVMSIAALLYVQNPFDSQQVRISWVEKVGAGLIGPACGSSSVSAGPTCSGATPVVTLTWSSTSGACNTNTAAVKVDGNTVASSLSCDASYQWTGGSIGASYTYEVTATDSNGAAHTLGTGNFTMPSSCAPTASLSANPSTIDAGQSSTLTWGSFNATSCTAAGGFSTGGATSGSASTGALSNTAIYQVTCNGLGGISNPAFATVTVLVPTVSISASPDRVTSGGAIGVTWNATNVNSCVITRNGAAWRTLTANGSRVVSGSASSTITSQTNFVMACDNNAGSSVATANVVANIVPGFQEF